MTEIMRSALRPIPPGSNLVDPDSFKDLMGIASQDKSSVAFLQLGESAATKAEVKSVCTGKCADVRGFVAEAFEEEEACGLGGVDVNKLKAPDPVPSKAADKDAPLEQPVLSTKAEQPRVVGASED